MNARSRQTRAFTLVEVMVAIVLLSVGLLALAGAGAHGARLMYRASVREKSAALARNRLERIRSSCTGGSGVERSGDYTVSWGSGADGSATVVVRPPSAAALSPDSFSSRSLCEP